MNSCKKHIVEHMTNVASYAPVLAKMPQCHTSFTNSAVLAAEPYTLRAASTNPGDSFVEASAQIPPANRRSGPPEGERSLSTRLTTRDATFAASAAAPLPPPPQPSGGIVEPLPVVAPHFCAPYVVQLNVQEQFGLREGSFLITDTNGAVVITVKGAFISIHNRRILFDAGGNPLLCLREKVNIN